jgi:hypothetical protein
MAVSSNADRAREEQEQATEQPPVFKCEEKKLIPLESHLAVNLDEEPDESTHEAIEKEVLEQISGDIRRGVKVYKDDITRQYNYHLRLWVEP